MNHLSLSSRLDISARSSRSGTRKRAAFTLIELLVVIAIIGLLAAILFPVFGRARENARRSACQSNLKQLGIAFQQYSQDFDERYPIVYNTLNTFTWDRSIAPYVGIRVAAGGSPLVFKCPSDSLVDASSRFTRSYAMPYRGNSADGLGAAVVTYVNITSPPEAAFTGMIGVTLARVEAPSETILLVELPFTGNHFGSNSGVYAQCAYGGTSCQDRNVIGDNVPIHFKGWNYLFSDGHVKWLTPEKTIGPKGTGLGPQGMWTVDPKD